MDKHYTYLLINFLTIFFPVILSFDSRVQFHKSWKFIFPGLFLSGLLFLVWDYIFTVYNVWSFNEAYITGVHFLQLPVEEILFFLTVPFACLFIYECLNYYVKKDVFERIRQMISVALAILSLAILLFFSDRVYTLITFSLLLALSLYLIYKNPSYLGRFYLAYLISLLPFYIVNGLLTSLPVVLYNNAENMAVRVWTIPFEDHFYSLALLLMNVMFFECFRGKNKAAHG